MTIESKEKIKKKISMQLSSPLADKGACFQHTTNKITFIPATGEHTVYPLKIN